MNKIVLLIIAILIVAAGGYFIWKSSKTATAPDYTPPTAPQVKTPGAGSSLKEITVSGNEFSFNPSSITLKAGEKVKVNFRNTGNFRHNLTIEGLSIGSKTIAGGKTDVFEFTAPASGTYAIFCSVPTHREKGMEGILKTE